MNSLTTQETTSVVATPGKCWAALTSSGSQPNIFGIVFLDLAKPESLDLSASFTMAACALSSSTAMFTFAASFLACSLTLWTVADFFASTYRAGSHWVSPYKLMQGSS